VGIDIRNSLCSKPVDILAITAITAAGTANSTKTPATNETKVAGALLKILALVKTA